MESVAIVSESSNLVAGQILQLRPKILPSHPDNSSLIWTSDNENIASVSANGTVSAISEGPVVLKATSESNHLIYDEIKLTVSPLIKPYIEIINANKIKNTKFVVGDTIELDVNYHAGTGNTVISADEGGIRFWLREFKYEWIPEKDIIKVDASALNTESGNSTMAFSLDDLTPTDELPKGHFYYLNTSFTSSNGNAYSNNIYPIKILSGRNNK